MKRFLASLICTVLLLGLLSALTPGAQMLTGHFTIEANRPSAFVGDSIIWNYFHNGYSYSGTVYAYLYMYNNGTYTAGMALPTNTLSGTAVTQTAVAGRHTVALHLLDSGPSLDVFSAPVYVSLRPAPKNVKAEAVSGTTLKITWKAVPGATGYEVWRSLSKSSGYSLVKTTTATSWSNTYRTPGTRYFYKIRSTNLITLPTNQGSVPSGQFSAPVAGVPLAKAAITGAAGVSTTQIKLTWKKVTGAMGYQVFRSATASGTYKLIKTTTALSFTAGGMLHAKTYYFKVRPYKAFGTVKYYGPLSAYRAGKTK